MKEENIPRPNVATAFAIGLIVALVFQLFSDESLSAESFTAAVVPILGFVVSFFFPAYQKTFGALIGAGLPTLILIVFGGLQGEVIDFPQLQSLLIAISMVFVTAKVPNTKGR
jgi:hypothetical protein